MHVVEICNYMKELENRFRWEVIIVNDGSSDDSPVIADELASEFANLRVLHHPTNFGVGQALRFGINNTIGDYVVTMDVDLSYDVQHIEELINEMQQSHAKVVLASPYMKGGSIKNVPFNRKLLSILGNKFLTFFSQADCSTVTCMVRAHDGPFIRSLDLRSLGLDLMPETLYKAMILRAGITEIPGRLDWGPQLKYGQNRTSSMRIFRHISSTVMSGFVFRPMHFFIFPGILLAMFSIYVSYWMFAHYFEALIPARAIDIDATKGDVLAQAYNNYPHTYLVGFASIILSVQLLSLGFLSLQNKRNHEELYHLNSTKFDALKKTMENSRES